MEKKSGFWHSKKLLKLVILEKKSRVADCIDYILTVLFLYSHFFCIQIIGVYHGKYGIVNGTCVSGPVTSFNKCFNLESVILRYYFWHVLGTCQSFYSHATTYLCDHLIGLLRLACCHTFRVSEGRFFCELVLTTFCGTAQHPTSTFWSKSKLKRSEDLSWCVANSGRFAHSLASVVAIHRTRHASNSRVSINNTHSLILKLQSFWSLLINTTSVCPKGAELGHVMLL